MVEGQEVILKNPAIHEMGRVYKVKEVKDSGWLVVSWGHKTFLIHERDLK